MLNKGTEPTSSVPSLPLSSLPQKAPVSTNKSDLIVLASSKLLRGVDFQKIKGLESNVTSMNADFALMKKAKDEAKIKLEQRFTEVQRQIDSTKTFVEAESKKMTDTFSILQTNFEADIDKLTKGTSKIQNELAVDLNKKFVEVNIKCQEIEEIISHEKQERTTFVSTALSPLIARIENLEKALELERDLRKQKEKELAKKLAEDNSKTSEKFDNERLQRMAQVKELNMLFKTDLKQQQTYAEDLSAKMHAELKQMANNIDKEMDNRFEQQDKIVDNLTHMIQTFQATLKVISEDA